MRKSRRDARVEAPPTAWDRVLGARASAVHMGVALVAVGVVMRLLAPFFMDLRMDGNTYAAMGHAWAEGRGFLLPWGDVTTWDCTGPQHSHHYPPAYPAYLGLVYKAFGFGLWQTKWAAVAVSLAALAVVWATTADLLGRARAWVATGILAVEPHLVWATGTNFSENMVLLFFALTMWGILKALDDPRFVVVAGIAAGLAYWSRAGMGSFFIVAGFAGLAWRFRFMGWAVFRDKAYLLAAAIFAAFVGSWAWRNVARFGWPNWHTSSYTQFTQDWALQHPWLLAEGLAWKLPLFVAFLLHYLVFLAPEARASLRRVREERESALWLAIVLVTLIGWVIASIYWTWERYDVWWLDNHRYVVIAFLPVVWMALAHADVTAPLRPRRGIGFPLRAGALALTLVATSAYAFVQPTEFPETRVATMLNPHLEAGTEIGIEGVIVKYSFYPYLARHDVVVYGCRATPTDACPGQDPDYILSLYRPHHHPGYSTFLQHTVHYVDGSEPFTGTVYKRDAPPIPGPRSPGCNPA